ncbi:MAG: hypothetical protein ACLFP6_13030 [Spirochaetaceae bacterium]
MGDAMELSQSHLETIGSYVKKNLPTWLGEINYPFSPAELHRKDLELRERTVRVEEELKGQRDLMRQGFEQVDRRFEQVDKRFEQVDKRFDQLIHHMDARFEQVDQRFADMQRHTTRWMTVLSLMIALMGVAVTVSNLVG